MPTVAYQTVLREASGLAGFGVEQLTATAKTHLRTFINRRAREYHEMAWWSDLMASTLRYYRPAYSAGTAYATGDQVHDPATGIYYTALGATLGNPPTDPAFWALAADLDAYVLLGQPGLPPIGTVRLISQDDPRTVTDPRPQPHRIIGDRIQILGGRVPGSVYVWHRPPPTEYLGEDWSAATAYATDAAVYYASANPAHAGDFWRALASTAAGESPETASAKWQRLTFPAILRSPVAQAAYADWLRTEEKPAQAAFEQNVAERLLLKAIIRDTAAQRQT